MDGVSRGTKRPPRIAVYGPPGVGKTTLASDAPGGILLPTEDGADGLEVDQFPLILDWDSFKETVARVAKEDHEYQTVIVDTLNGAADLAGRHICRKVYGSEWTGKKGNSGFWAWGGQGWRVVAEEFRVVLFELDKCRQRGMTIVLIAHQGMQNVRHPTEGDYSKWSPALHKSVWGLVHRWTDIILRADYETAVHTDEKGRGRAYSTTTRRLYCRGTAAEDGKCRAGYELPEEMDLRWDEIATNLGSVKATLEEVRQLWGDLTEEEREKGLRWLGVEELAKAPKTRMRQLLNRLRQKAQEKGDDDAAR